MQNRLKWEYCTVIQHEKQEKKKKKERKIIFSIPFQFRNYTANKEKKMCYKLDK